MLVGTGCSVPGIMASRTIEQERDRRMTVITTSFMPCGAKMPMVGLVAGALFADSFLGGAWVATSAYFMGVAAVMLSGLILKKTKPFSGDSAPFVMELPSYHAPVARNILHTAWERGWSFIKRAGTVIMAASMIIWVLNSLSFEGGIHYITEDMGGRSILEALGSLIAWLFKPLGFGCWQAAVATVLGLVAKEEIVGVFGALGMGSAETAMSAIFEGNGLAGFTFMTFNLLCAPCFAAMGAIKREMNSAKWTAFTITYLCVFAYTVSFIIYRIGALFQAGFTLPNTIGALVALLLVGVILYLLARPAKQAKHHA
jgi:ferrous iron transport protein B